MLISAVIQALHNRYAANLIGSNIAGAAELQNLNDRHKLSLPYAFVIPLEDTPAPNASLNAINQELKEGFAIVVAFSNGADERGQSALDQVHEMRRLILLSILGWEPSEVHSPIEYEGGRLVEMTRAYVLWMFEFSTTTQLTDEDGYHHTLLNDLPPYEGGTVRVDAINPRDPNAPGAGPDGRIDGGFTFNVPTT